MSWIKTISYQNATGKLKALYDRIKGPNDYLDNILKVHSLRPHTLEGHMKLYKNVLHHLDNQLPKWLLEAIGVYVSLLNSCEYCVQHHFQGMRKLLNDDTRSNVIFTALKQEDPASAFHDKELAIFNYAAKLTKSPNSVSENDVKDLRESGFSDEEILEINQVVSYFAYANRTVLGLGVNIDGDIIGLSPSDSDNPNNWQHK